MSTDSVMCVSKTSYEIGGGSTPVIRKCHTQEEYDLCYNELVAEGCRQHFSESRVRLQLK